MFATSFEKSAMKSPWKTIKGFFNYQDARSLGQGVMDEEKKRDKIKKFLSLKPKKKEVK